jgi:hypothetical protein
LGVRFLYPAFAGVPENTPYPVLPKRKDGKVIFPTGTFSGMWFSEEIKFAVSKGAKVLSAHWGVAFNSSDELFKDQI